MMKRILTGLALLLSLITLQAQTQEYMIIEKADGTSLKLGIDEIRQMYFDMDVNSDFGKKADAVDLGLCVKWASWNIGATKIGENGGYYGWGDPTGLLTSTSDDDYAGSNPPKVISGTEYDIAHVQWGGKWRLPTYYEMKELVDECTWTYGTYGGQNCVTAKGPNDRTIIFPLAGRYKDKKIEFENISGYYYTGSYFEKDDKLWAYFLWLPKDSDKVYSSYGSRRYIRDCVRPVFGDNVTVITRSSFTYSDGDVRLYGTVAAAIGVNSFTRGFFISKSGTPTSSNNIKKVENSDKNADGYFYSPFISDLDPGTSYNFCAYVYADGKYYYGKTLTFTTNAAATTLTVKPTSLTLANASGSTESFTITCNKDWNITGVPNWLNISQTSGNGNATIKLTAKETYAGVEDRSSEKIKITASGTTATVEVSQKGVGQLFNVTGAPVNLASNANAVGIFTINTNIPFTLSCNADWLEVTPKSGVTTTEISVKAKTANPSNQERFGTISINNALYESYSVDIIQAGSEASFIYREPYTEWGAAKSQVKKYMSSYEIYQETEDVIAYLGLHKEALIMYGFDSSILTTALVVVDESITTLAAIEAQFQNNGYVLVGTVDGVTFYMSSDKKTIAMIELDTEYSSFKIQYYDADEFLNPDSGKTLFEEPYVSWGTARSVVKSAMSNRGYNLQTESLNADDNYYLVYDRKYKEQYSMYLFDESLKLARCILPFQSSVVSVDEAREFLSSSMNYTFMGTNSAKTQFFYLTQDKKSYAVVESMSTNNGGTITVIRYMSYDSVSSNSRLMSRGETRSGEVYENMSQLAVDADTLLCQYLRHIIEGVRKHTIEYSSKP